MKIWTIESIRNIVWEMQIKWIRHSAVNLAGFLDPVPEDSEGEGRKIGEAGERDRVEVFSDQCCNG